MDKLNQQELGAFWRFCVERQNIWHKRYVLQQPPPWTQDPILQTGHFTNAYRELDPGTAWMVENILDNPYLSAMDKAFWCLAYRYFGSNRKVWQVMPLTPIEVYDPKKIAKVLNSYPNPFGNAYLVFPMVNEKSELSRVELVTAAFGEIAEAWPRIWSQAQSASWPEASWQAIRDSRKGIGDFTSYQAWLDMLYPDSLGHTLLPWTRNDFVVPGPGAIAGAATLGANGKRQTRGLIHWLHVEQKNEIKRLGLRMRWLVAGPCPHGLGQRGKDFRCTRCQNQGWPQPGSKMELWLSDIQNLLCEFGKYVRIRDTGRITRRYVAGAAR